MSGEPISLRAAADQLGLHYMTVYRYVRTGRLAATKRGGQWFVDPADLASLGASAADDAPKKRTVRTNAAAHLESRLLVADEAGAWGVVTQALTSGAEPEEIHLKLLIPAMRAVGERWADGEIEVFDEHQATVIATRITARLGPRFHRRGRTRGRIVVGLPSGDGHALATAIISDLLRGRGYDVTDLGADTPPGSFLDAIGPPGADPPVVGVVVSSSNVSNLDQAAATVAAVKESRPNLTVALGGLGVPSEAEADRCGADIWAADVEGLLARLDELAPEA